MPSPHRPADPTVVLWSLTEDVLVEDRDGGTVTVLTRWGEVELEAPGAVGDFLHRMTLGPVLLDNVLTRPGGGRAGLDHGALDRALRALTGSVVRSVALRESGTVLLSVTPLAADARFAPVSLGADAVVRLSRRASLRTDGDRLVLHAPDPPHLVQVHHPDAALVLACLATPTTVTATARWGGLPTAVVREVVVHLVAVGAARIAGPGAAFAEDATPSPSPSP